MDNENMVTVPKKKSPIGIIVLMVVLMLGCLVGGYFLNESGVFNKDKKDTTEKSKGKEKEKDKKDPIVTNYDVMDQKVAGLISDLMQGGFSYGGCTALEKFTNDKKVTAGDLDDLVIYHIIEAKEFLNKKDSFTLDEFKTAMKKYFADDATFEPNSIDYKGKSCPQYNYDMSTKTFNKQQTACGGTCGPVTSYRLDKAVDTDGILKLDVKVVFTKYDSGTEYDYFGDYAKTNGIGTFDDDIYSLFDKGSNYQFTFKLVDGNYVFVSSEPVK